MAFHDHPTSNIPQPMRTKALREGLTLGLALLALANTFLPRHRQPLTPSPGAALYVAPPLSLRTPSVFGRREDGGVTEGQLREDGGTSVRRRLRRPEGPDCPRRFAGQSGLAEFLQGRDGFEIGPVGSRLGNAGRRTVTLVISVSICSC
jgi:hypothetical protein